MTRRLLQTKQDAHVWHPRDHSAAITDSDAVVARCNGLDEVSIKDLQILARIWNRVMMIVTSKIGQVAIKPEANKTHAYHSRLGNIR